MALLTTVISHHI
uniref:Uncharacterized protein n=1 Tax=Rhizophora mucronata TaxID=61149 RepID=A0A2P2N9U8_RHIMU